MIFVLNRRFVSTFWFSTTKCTNNICLKSPQLCPIWLSLRFYFAVSDIPVRHTNWREIPEVMGHMEILTNQFTDNLSFKLLPIGAVKFGSQVGQIGPKWDISGTFSDQISVHLTRGRQSEPLWSQTYHPWVVVGSRDV